MNEQVAAEILISLAIFPWLVKDCSYNRHCKHSFHSANDPTAKQTAINSFLSQWSFKDFHETQNAVTAAARSLLTRIMNVNDGTPQSDER